ncbi:hypothetical protein ED92_11035 [Amycolatopsis sp. MJM2582]|uniref:hypothetical protein n=1 Tax=Amycolatopsis sp. MJM2582 TaxID=1427749 RepID=UPI0005049192|nr:hypothetical protein [Amycolatopsis sp. MJM2582]KFZ80847.1 hypothetical protein ED92_11035 [Amycolatopsis sp. MJM2582]
MHSTLTRATSGLLDTARKLKAPGSTLARMVAADQPDVSAGGLQHLLAVRAERFATEQAVDGLRQAIKRGDTDQIAAGVTGAIDAVHHLATMAAASPDDTTSTHLRAQLHRCQTSFQEAYQQDDTDGIIGHGELVGDAVMNYAILLTNL